MGNGQETVSAIDEAAALLDERLARTGARGPSLTLEGLVQVDEGLPDWWAANGNRFLCRAGSPLPELSLHGGLPPPRDAIVLAACATMPGTITLWGEAPLVVLGHDCSLPSIWLCCGGPATLVIGDGTRATWGGIVDSRNGGLVSVGRDGLWAAGVRLQSDDMHAIRDGAGARINAFGGVIIVEDHVWLGLEAMLLGGSHVGSGAVIGARSVVTGRLPADAVSVGVPARPVRQGINWEFADTP